MDTVVALGDAHRLEGFALGGVRVVAAATPEAVRDGWRGLGAGVALVLLTPAAADVLGARRWERADRLTVVVP